MRCKATTASGKPCKASALKGKRACWFHSRATAQARRAAAARGGSRRSVELDAPPLSVRRARRLLAGLLRALIDGEVSTDVARAAGGLVSVDRRVAEAAELEALEGRLDAVEARLQSGRPSWGRVGG